MLELSDTPILGVANPTIGSSALHAHPSGQLLTGTNCATARRVGIEILHELIGDPHSLGPRSLKRNLNLRPLFAVGHCDFYQFLPCPVFLILSRVFRFGGAASNSKRVAAC